MSERTWNELIASVIAIVLIGVLAWRSETRTAQVDQVARAACEQINVVVAESNSRVAKFVESRRIDILFLEEAERAHRRAGDTDTADEFAVLAERQRRNKYRTVAALDCADPNAQVVSRKPQ